ncbi:MAG: LytTR family DNA-binding domain-containing protein [Chitinivorax sp.]
MTCSTAVIADDEPLLLCALRLQLQQLWPELQIVGAAANGIDALRLLGELQPDVAFLDIKMPGLSGLDVALAARTTHVVFVTAYDQYAVEAFDKQAVDYLLKPVNEQRLGKTIARLQQKLAPATNAPNTAPAKEWLRWIRAGSGNDVRLIDVDDVSHFHAADKYTEVVTAAGDFIIRMSIRELQAQLDPSRFWQIHRSTIVRVDAIARASRDDSGRITLTLKQSPHRLAVSKPYAHLFRQM